MIDWGALTVICGMILLTYYRVNKKFKKEKKPGLKDFLERNLVELIIAIVIIPGGADTALGIFDRILK